MSTPSPHVKALLDRIAVGSQPRFKLYHYDGCGFCSMVRRAASHFDVELELVNIFQVPGARELLLERRGRTTVPVLAVPTEKGEELLPESADIVDFLEGFAARRAAG